MVERREERKIVSVVFADLVGFTGRSETLDVEEVRGTLAPYHEALRAILERFGGTVEKFIGERSSPCSARRRRTRTTPSAPYAPRCACATRSREIGEDLHVRIGVNTGEALVAVGAQPLAGEGMVSGDVVNTAARLQSAAPIDGVLVGEATYRATERQIVFEARDAVDGQGEARARALLGCVAAPLAAAVAAARRGAAGRPARRGRVAASSALRRVRETSSPQLVTLIGVPGIGKTRLVGELRRFIEGEAELTTWREGRVLAYGEGIAFSALAQIVKQQAGILESDGAAAAARSSTWRSMLRDLRGWTRCGCGTSSRRSSARPRWATAAA